MNIVVLVDSFTRATSDVAFDALSKRTTVITDIRELSEEYLHNEYSLVIFEPALQVIVTPEILQESDIQCYIVYQTEERVLPFKSIATLVKADYSEITWNFVYGVVNSDVAILEPYQNSRTVIDSFSSIRSKIPEELQDYFTRFFGTYLALAASADNLVTKNSQLVDLIEAQSSIGNKAIKSVLELKNLLEYTQSKVTNYEALLSKTIDLVFNGFYPERPRVLYIKQISHVSGLDTLLSVLFSSITQQYKSSCKVIKLVDSANSISTRYIPMNYIPVTDKFNTGDVLRNDFILKLGTSRLMWDTLMLNRSGLEYLIVHDMRGVMRSALDPTLIDLFINEVSPDYASLGEYTNVLSGYSTNFVEYLWDYKEISEVFGSKIVTLTGHPTVSDILEVLMS